MPLSPGTRFGPYEIVAPLGAGGMGEVYRARDTRLGRDVAVKVLPEHCSTNAEIRARFEREAKTISSLNHPHICALYDVGRAPGEAGSRDIDYLVMELIEGETLAARLTRGALPPGDVVRLGAQIADALDRAHRAGVVHRDLKPGNVMLARSGAKLMDFGLARATGLSSAGDRSASIALTQSPTVAQPLTAEGTLVGTFQYMAPEQLEGREADARADLWALGCVLYEMATGRRAFDGQSQASLIGAIMHTTPQPPSQIAPLTPPALDRLVNACLAKDPADRVQSAHDVKLQLEWMAEGTGSTAGAEGPALAVRRRAAWPGLASVAVAAAVVATLVTWWVARNGAQPAGPKPAQRYIVAEADLRIQSSPVIAPGGDYIVFSVLEGASERLYRRNLASLETAPIAGTEGGFGPFFSPDGAWIGFLTEDAVKKVPAAGGLAKVVLPGMRVGSADWGPDGMIYIAPRAGGADGATALARVPAAGGSLEVVARLDTTAGEVEAWLPEVLPGGKTILLAFVTSGGWNLHAVRSDGTRQLVLPNAMLARYTDSGHLLYFDFDPGATFAAPFDARAVKFTGPAIPLTEPVSGSHGFDVGKDGTLVYVPGSNQGAGRELAWVNRGGGTTRVMETEAAWAEPRIAPDGRRIVMRKAITNCELWMYDLDRESLARIAHPGDNHSPIWSPDGRRIAYVTDGGAGRLQVMRVDGVREDVTRLTRETAGSPGSWIRPGDLLTFDRTGRGTQGDIYVVPMSPGGEPAPYLVTASNERAPSMHPSGQWIAYTSNETGTPEVLVRRYPDTGEVWPVSNGMGGTPLWAPDGRSLYYVAGQRLMQVSVVTTPALRFGAPTPVADGVGTGAGRAYDVAPDGRVVVVRTPGGGIDRRQIRVLLNWEHEVARVSTAGH